MIEQAVVFAHPIRIPRFPSLERMRRSLCCKTLLGGWLLLHANVLLEPSHAQQPISAQTLAETASGRMEPEETNREQVGEAVSSRSAPADLRPETWPAGRGGREELPTERTLEYQFTDVKLTDITGWLDWLGLELPVKLEGNLTGWLWAQRSPKAWWRLGDYRVEGEVSSRQLKLETWVIDQAAIRFGYTAGTWYVGNLKGVVQADPRKKTDQKGASDTTYSLPTQPTASDPAIGRILGQAKLETGDNQLLSMQASLADVDLNGLVRSLGIDLDLGSGGGNLEFQGQVPLFQSASLSAWEGRIRLALEAVEFSDLAPVDLLAPAVIGDGQLTIDEGSVQVAQQRVPFEATVGLDGAFPYNVSTSKVTLDLPGLIGSFNLPSLQDEIAGKLSFTSKISGSSLGVDHAELQLDSAEVTYKALKLSPVQLSASVNSTDRDLQYIVQLTSIGIGEGELAGQASWNGTKSLTAGVPSSAQLQMQSIDLQELSKAFGNLRMAGIVNGTTEIASETADGPRPWSISSSIACLGLQLADTSFGDINLTVDKPATSSVAEVSLEDDGQSVDSQLKIYLEHEEGDPLLDSRFAKYSADGRIERFQTHIRMSAQSLTVPIQVSGGFHLEGNSDNPLSRGEAELSNLEAQLGDRNVQLDAAQLMISPSEFRLTRFRVRDPVGRIAGSAILDRQAPYQHQFNLRVAEAKLHEYVDLIPFPELRTVQGTVNLEFQLRKQGSIEDFFADWSGEISGSLQDVAYRGESLGELSLVGRVANQQLQAELTGQVLGGKLEAAYRSPLSSFQRGGSETQAAKDTSPVRPDQADRQTHAGHEQTTPAAIRLTASVSDIDLERALRISGVPPRKNRLFGRASVLLQGTGGELDDLTLTMRLAVPVSNLGSEELTRNVKLAAKFQRGVLQLEELSGRFAGGRIRARGAIQFVASGERRYPVGQIQFDASLLRIESILRLLIPDSEPLIEGVAGYRGRLQFSRNIVAAGSAELSQAKVSGLSLEQVRGRLRVGLAPDFALREIVASDLHGRAVGGTLSASLKLRGGANYELEDSRLRISQGRLDELSESLGFPRIVGTGRFNTLVSLRSKRLTELSALSGSVTVNLGDCDSRSVPLLGDMATYAPLLAMASTQIKEGVMHAQIGGGQFRITDLFLNSNAFWMVADGTVGLRDTRLDLNALLQTGGGLEQQIANSGLQKAAIAVLPQAALAAEIANLLANRSLYFRIRGTAQHPVIQPRLVETAARALVDSVRRALLAAPSSSSASASGLR